MGVIVLCRRGTGLRLTHRPVAVQQVGREIFICTAVAADRLNLRSKITGLVPEHLVEKTFVLKGTLENV